MKELVGPYRIRSLLGHGGMGVVYLGVHDHLGREVAIKALAPELTQHPQFRERFFAEARVQAKLQHTNIVAIYDLIEDAGSYFIVMEHVPGPTLEALLKEGATKDWEVDHALALFRQILAGLDYAHSKGVIHRDVKSSNVLIADGAQVKLTDFGIALLIGDKRLTASQSTIGTPTYMSPEQILRPRLVDHRSDVYSAAIVLYEMLAGQPPFDAETEYEIKKLQIEAPVPDVRTVNPKVPAAVAEAITTALRKDPDERFPSAGAFLRALQRGQGNSEVVGERDSSTTLAVGSPISDMPFRVATSEQGPRSAVPLLRRRVLSGVVCLAVLVVVLWSLQGSSPDELRELARFDNPSLAKTKTDSSGASSGVDKNETGSILEADYPRQISTQDESLESEQIRLTASSIDGNILKGPGESLLPKEESRGPGTVPPAPANGALGSLISEQQRGEEKRADIQARVERVRGNISAKNYAAAQKELDVLHILAAELPPEFEGEKESIRLLSEHIALSWSEKIQHARLLLRQGNTQLAVSMAQEVVKGGGVSEALRREARAVVIEGLARESGGQVLHFGKEIQETAIPQTSYKSPDALLIRIEEISGPVKGRSRELAFKLRFLAHAPDPEEVLVVIMSGQLGCRGRENGWSFQQAFVVPGGGGIVEIPITAKFPFWIRGACTLALTLSEKTSGLQHREQVEFQI